MEDYYPNRKEKYGSMRIVVNGRFLTRKITGVERYAKEILIGLDKLSSPGEIILAVPKNYKANTIVLENIETVEVGKLTNREWEHISLPIYAIHSKRIPLSFCNVAPLVYPGICTIFDMKIKSHPEYYSKKFLAWYNLLFSNQIRRADFILTDSGSAKNEIIKYYPKVNKDKLIVIPCAWQHTKSISFDEGALKKYHLNKGEYYFSIGSLEPNKNFKWVAEEAKLNPGRIYAVAGTINRKVFSDGIGFNCPNNMKLLGYVTDEEAKTLMRDCRGFLFPSFYEGFGMPPLEAMSAGCKNVVVSDIEVMHEIFEDSVTYIDPNLHNIKYDSIKLSNEKCQIILKKYSWDKSARELYKLLNDINN